MKSTKSGKVRRVPVADRALGIVRGCAAGKGGEELLFTTTSGHRLHAAAVKLAMHWDVTGAGRRIHDLRHTAACLWLARGVDPGTVKAWMGHSSIATTNLYLHHLGTRIMPRWTVSMLRGTPGHTGTGSGGRATQKVHGMTGGVIAKPPDQQRCTPPEQFIP